MLKSLKEFFKDKAKALMYPPLEFCALSGFTHIFTFYYFYWVIGVCSSDPLIFNVRLLIYYVLLWLVTLGVSFLLIFSEKKQIPYIKEIYLWKNIPVWYEYHPHKGINFFSLYFVIRIGHLLFILFFGVCGGIFSLGFWTSILVSSRWINLPPIIEVFVLLFMWFVFYEKLNMNELINNIKRKPISI